jgi:hypothetical protein
MGSTGITGNDLRFNPDINKLTPYRATIAVRKSKFIAVLGKNNPRCTKMGDLGINLIIQRFYLRVPLQTLNAGSP